MQKLTRLRECIHEVSDIQKASAVLSWDQQTNMPPGGAPARAEQMGTLDRIAHERFVRDEVGDLLADLSQHLNEFDPRSDEASLIRVCQHNYDKKRRVPSTYVAAFSKATALAQHAWEEARAKSDFSIFQPHLKEVVDLRKEYASFFAPYDHVYDPLLDDFERGLRTADVQRVFAELRKGQVELLRRIQGAEQVDNSFRFLNYPSEAQWDFGVSVITRFGYDWNKGRQDRSVHPFSTSFSVNDVRITTRLSENDLQPGLFGTLHEAGHGLYEMGVAATLDRTPLGQGASLGVHESQSRLWENLVGRSRAFWQYFYPQLQVVFPSQLGDVSLDAFYKGINRVEPTFIRVEADEATYNLHVMLRLELEIALMEGTLAVDDLPDAWNERCQEYLGITPPDDAQGVLQDVHWSFGLLGYFPTYALGNVLSAQLWACINKDLPDLRDQIAQGEFGALLGWLRTKVHRHGAKFEPKALVREVTGKDIDPKPYLDYLTSKYSYIYGL